LTGFLYWREEIHTLSVRNYQTVFGFTEEEAFKALEESALESKKADVKRWYFR